MKKISLKVKAYNLLKEKIVNCSYAPGMDLNEDFLMEELQIGRTPIKDALGRLEQEGLIIIKPKKGVIVAPLTFQDINMIFEMRNLYEPYALIHYGSQIPEKKLHEFYEIFANPDLNSYAEDQTYYYSLDSDFHDTIIHACPNTYIHRSYKMIQNQSERFRYMTGTISEKRISDTFLEHLCVLKPLLEKDWQSAGDQLLYHLLESKKATVKLLMANAEHLSII